MLSKKLNLHGYVIYLAKLVLISLVLTTIGCGQSGDLTLPKKDYVVQ